MRLSTYTATNPNRLHLFSGSNALTGFSLETLTAAAELWGIDIKDLFCACCTFHLNLSELQLTVVLRPLSFVR